jgi:hypothetical protein
MARLPTLCSFMKTTKSFEFLPKTWNLLDFEKYIRDFQCDSENSPKFKKLKIKKLKKISFTNYTLFPHQLALGRKPIEN